MTDYKITAEDIEELQQYRGTNTMEEGFWKRCQTLLKKSKWSVQDLRTLNGWIENNLGHLLYQLFEIKAKHPLFMKYYGEDPGIQPQRSLEDLITMVEKLRSENVPIENYHKYGLRIRSFDEMIPDHERRQLDQEVKAYQNNTAQVKAKFSNKDNTYRSKR